MDLANWALRTSPKFTIGLKYQFHHGFFFDQIRDSEIPITLRPIYIYIYIQNIIKLLYYIPIRYIIFIILGSTSYIIAYYITFHYITLGEKGDWDFRISDLVKNPDGTDI